MSKLLLKSYLLLSQTLLIFNQLSLVVLIPFLLLRVTVYQLALVQLVVYLLLVLQLLLVVQHFRWLVVQHIHLLLVVQHLLLFHLLLVVILVFSALHHLRLKRLPLHQTQLALVNLMMNQLQTMVSYLSDLLCLPFYFVWFCDCRVWYW